MVEYLSSFLRRNNLKIKIDKVKYGGQMYYSLKLIKMTQSSRESSIAILKKYNKPPSAARFIGDVIDSILSGNLPEQKVNSIKRLLGGDIEFGRFLEIETGEDVNFSSVMPKKNSDYFTVDMRFLGIIEPIKSNKFHCKNSTEIMDNIGSNYVGDICIYDAVIRGMEFLKDKNTRLDSVQFVRCDIYSINGLNKLDHIKFFQCTFYASVSDSITAVNNVEFDECRFLNSKPFPFVAFSDNVTILRSSIDNLYRVFPTTTNAKSIGIFHTKTLKTLSMFPNAPRLEKLIIRHGGINSTLGLPESLPMLKSLEISYCKLKSVEQIPRSSSLIEINFRGNKIENLPISSGSVMILNISENPADAFHTLGYLPLLHEIHMRKMEGGINISKLAYFPMLDRIDFAESQFRIDTHISPNILLIILKSAIKDGSLVTKTINTESPKKSKILTTLLKRYYEAISQPDEDRSKRLQYMEYFKYALSYCNANLVSAVGVYCRIGSEWALEYIKNEYEPEHYYEAMEMAASARNTERAKKVIVILREKYREITRSYSGVKL